MSAIQEAGVERKVEMQTDSHHDEVLTKRDEAAIGVAEEHGLSIGDVLRNNKRIVFWCIFFSMSAVGWGFDAQVNGAMM